MWQMHLHITLHQIADARCLALRITRPGDLIYEPFCGSGTQIVAAERAGRRCFAMELDPVYCDVAVRRWEMATGRKAQLEDRNKTTIGKETKQQ
ncbi:MAG: DNA methyltransferase [Hyphomonas sp.]